MTNEKMKYYLVFNIGTKLEIDKVQANKGVYKQIFLNAIAQNQGIVEYLKGLGFTLINEDRWRGIKYSSIRYNKRKLFSSVEGKKKEYDKNYIKAQRSPSYKANGTK